MDRLRFPFTFMEDMKMYRSIVLTGALLISLLCLNAYADVWQDPQSAPQQTVGVPAFDINPYIAKLRQAWNEFSNAGKNDAQAFKAAFDQFNNKKNAIFNEMFNARRAQYAAARFTVTRHCAGDAPAKKHAWDGHQYREGDVRITNPDPNQFVMIPGSGQVTDVKVDNRNGSAAKFENARQEGNDFVVQLWIKGPDYRRSGGRIDVTLVAQYRYNDARLNSLTNGDIIQLQKRVEDSLK